MLKRVKENIFRIEVVVGCTLRSLPRHSSLCHGSRRPSVTPWRSSRFSYTVPAGPSVANLGPLGTLYQGSLPHSLVGSNSSIPHHSTDYQPYSPRTRPCSRRPLGASGSEVGLKQKLWRPTVDLVCLLLGQRVPLVPLLSTAVPPTSLRY